ncbi:alpha/beta hydrolase superfamily protein-like [Janibacter sp. HTCC2649]|uniref:alpha/beta fold hydrolase n=1 Tax=Janibacter sp. HTCC2649 TaxID=313589 RepID=UPI000066EB13|nr:alpha/beta hydrolase [Janibacter sp. HTCC2649]EAP98889.1 alpha/beta hydrolase superfamily protein-like [Janibacter sp. HTCC2649]
MRVEPSFSVEVSSGTLAVHDLIPGAFSPGAPVVLALHGITANGLAWQVLADELVRRHGAGAVRLLAPDLRGRAASRDVPGPYGIGIHAADALAVASAFGGRPILVGHSMGAFVAAVAAASEPERFHSVVLVDGGLGFPVPATMSVDDALSSVIGPAMTRLSMVFDSPEDHLAFWRRHPAVGPLLAGPGGLWLRRYLDHDLIETEQGWRSSCVLDAVRADGRDVLADPTTLAAVGAAVGSGVDVELLWAQRGLLDEPQGLYDEARLAALDLPSGLRTTAVPDTNHYSIILDTAPIQTLANVIDRQLA